MVTTLADIIKAEIENLDFIDRIEGMVTTARHRSRDNDGTITINRYPMVCGKNLSNCTPRDLIPNTEYCSIIYFEDNGSRDRGDSTCNSIKMESYIRLVCWYNVSKFGENCSYSDLFIAYILQNVLCKKVNNTDFLSNIRIYLDRIPERDSSIFSNYDYQDSVEYMMYPHDFFAIDFRIEYEFCKNITLEGVVKTPDACE